MNPNPTIEYSESLFTCTCYRRHLFKSKEYQLSLFKEGIVIGQSQTQNPKYLASLNLFTHPIEFYKPDCFAIPHNGKYRKFHLLPKHLEELIRCLRTKIFFKYINHYYQQGPIILKGNQYNYYKRYSNNEKNYYAVKTIQRHVLDNDKHKYGQFLIEIEVLKTLDKLFELYIDENNYYQITEYIGGSSLNTEMLMKSNGYTKQSTIQIIAQLLIMVCKLHDNQIIHRDLNPQIIFIDEYNEIYLMDYGMACFFDDEQSQTGYKPQGLPGYMAPELVNYKKGDILTEKVDLFSIGCIYYRLITGMGLFSQGQEDILEQNKQCKIDFSSIQFKHKFNQNLIQGLLEIDPNKRISAKQALQIIQESDINSPLSQLIQPNASIDSFMDQNQYCENKQSKVPYQFNTHSSSSSS